jgi:hypothetical protein
VGDPGANLDLFKHPLNLPVGASPQDTPTWWGCPTWSRKGWDPSMILRSGVANSTIEKIIHVQSEILVTIMSIWPSYEDNAIECGQENDIICYPGP